MRKFKLISIIVMLTVLLVVLSINVFATDNRKYSFNPPTAFVGDDSNNARIDVPVVTKPTVKASLEEGAGSRWRAKGYGVLTPPVTWEVSMAIQLWKDGRVNVTSTKTSYDTYTITHVTKYVIGDDVSQFGAVAEFSARDDNDKFVGIESDKYGNCY